MKKNSFLVYILKIIRPLRYYLDKKSYEFHYKNSENSIKKYKGKYRGKPLIIVGNGPSLNQTPMDSFLGIPSIGMNKINLLFDRVNWRPSLIISSNPFVIKQNMSFFSETKIPIFLSWKNRFILKGLLNKLGFYLQVNTKDFQKDFEKGVGAGSTITYAAMQFAYYTGANPVYLVGIDHSFETKPNSKKGAIEKRVGNDENHFDSNYFASGSFWQTPDLDDSETAYKLARIAFEEDGRDIYDATIGGKLKVFEKISINEMIKNLDR